MSDTPETDEKIIRYGWATDNSYVPAVFSQKLERERDEAIKTAERYRLELNALNYRLELNEQNK